MFLLFQHLFIGEVTTDTLTIWDVKCFKYIPVLYTSNVPKTFKQ